MKSIGHHISKQRILQSSSHHITASQTKSPERTQDGHRMPPPACTPLALGAGQPLQPPQIVTPEETQDEKTQGTEDSGSRW